MVNRPCRCNGFHNVSSSAECTNRQPAPDDFANTCQVWRHIEIALGAMIVDAQAGHDLINNKQRTVFVCDAAYIVYKVWLRRNNAHIAGDRLNNDSRDLLAVV